MEKLAIAFINHKGGVGKTTLSYILTHIGLYKGLKVTAIDLDPQKNLSDTLNLAVRAADKKKKQKELFIESLQIENKITEEGDFIVIDCPPVLNTVTAAAIDFADITLIPVMSDIFSVLNLGVVHKFALEHEKSKEQIAIVKVGFDRRALVEMIDMTLADTDYKTAGNVPINRMIPHNITLGNSWENKLNNKTREPYYRLYNRIWEAYQYMLNGNSEKAWEEK